jgi:hypothetical protein
MRRLALAALPIAVSLPAQPAWRALPERKPDGVAANTGAFIIGKKQETDWQRPAFVYDARVATGRKQAKVVVVIYDPVLEAHGGKTLREHVGGNDPRHYSLILADVIRQASWGYIDYVIVDMIEVDGYTKKVDGFRYTDETFLAAREKQQWQEATTSYRAVLEENGLVDRCKREGITEVWLWGASGMHFDEFAGFIPNRYARFGPTDNPWLYRPYDIPPELGRTTWVMGFNYEVGADNMVHSYTHRVESMAALAFADGDWDPKKRRDPWNVFSWLEMDTPGTPSMVGNCHVPPNGQAGYDYGNARVVPSWCDGWNRFPDLRGAPRPVSREDWGGTQFGYQKWILERLPKESGSTQYGYNNWWVYVANTDEDLPARSRPADDTFVLPEGFPTAVSAIK